MSEIYNSARRAFERDTLPFLRQRGFDHDADVLYQQCINFEVEGEFAGGDNSDDNLCRYLRCVLGMNR